MNFLHDLAQEQMDQYLGLLALCASLSTVAMVAATAWMARV